MVGPAEKREAVAHLRTLFEMSERRATTLVGADRTMIRYRSRRPDDAALRARLRDLAHQRHRFGYRRLYVLLRRDGEAASRNKVYRLYRAEGLAVRKRKARRRAVGVRAPLALALLPNARWSLDFVHDQLACGRRFRILNVVDDATRECLLAVADTSISGKRVVPRTDGARGAAWQTADDRLRQWHRVHLERRARLVRGRRRRLALHRARQADAERVLRELQRPHARRAPERDAVAR